ncbi:MAG TPA: iron ABC transporter permease [Verrucomicrobiae bacterium]|nr:iron ABC transporter permease [Verrucomicrobiae bacterium]
MRTLLAFPLMTLLCLAAAALALATGPMDIPLSHVAGALHFPFGTPPESAEAATVWQIRLPRVVLALLVGAALAQAGAAMQGIFRNPLADPGLVGISSGAALAAVAVIVLGESLNLFTVLPARFVLPVAAFAGGALATALVLRVALVDGHTRVATLLLSGLALNAVAGAGIGFFSHVATDSALRSVTFWMFGSLGKAGWAEIAVAAPLLIVPLVLLPREAHALDALLLGEAEAGHVGVAVEKLKRRVTTLVVLAAGAAVALAGIVAFVGLIVPHLVRLWAGPGHRMLLPASALLGALLLTLADTAARVMLSPTELPIGILTALVGGPLFFALLLARREAADA